jgi:hypothetical protein
MTMNWPVIGGAVAVAIGLLTLWYFRERKVSLENSEPKKVDVDLIRLIVLPLIILFLLVLGFVAIIKGSGLAAG